MGYCILHLKVEENVVVVVDDDIGRTNKRLDHLDYRSHHDGEEEEDIRHKGINIMGSTRDRVKDG